MNTQDKCSDSWGRIQPDRRAIRDAEVHRLAGPRVRQIRKELAAWIARARSEAGLSRREVVARMGYQKLERGVSRLALWERGDEAVWGDRIPALARALEAPVEGLAAFSKQELAALKAAEVVVAKRANANAAANESEQILLARFASELSEPGPVAERLRCLPDVLLRSSGWSVSLLGGGHFSLNFLMRAWRRGYLAVTCDCCGGTLLLTWVAGSPFSGRHRMRGICRTTCRVRTFTFPDPAEASKLLSFTTQITRGAGRNARHDITLAEVLSRAGLDVPVVRIRDSEGVPLAIFDPSSGVIMPSTDRPAVGDSGGVAIGLDLRVTPRRGPARDGGRPVIGSLAPLSFGARLGVSIELVDRDGGAWILHPGYLEDPERKVVAWFDAPVPVAVASWLVTQAPTSVAEGCASDSR